MGGKGGGGGTTKQVSEPWAEQKPYLLDIFKQSKDMYKSGALAPDYYAGNTVAPQSGWTQQALQMQADRALNGDASISTAKGAMDNIVSGGALAGNTALQNLIGLSGSSANTGNAGLDMTLSAGNAAMNNAGLPLVQQQATQDVTANNAGLGMIKDAAANLITGNAGLPLMQQQATQDMIGGNSALDTLTQMSSGTNPYLDALYADAAGQARAQIDSGFTSAGRYGSGAHENARADAMTDLAAQMYANAYDKQLDAASAAGSLYLQGGAQNANNAATLAGLYGDALNSQLGAGAQYGSLYNSGAAQNANNAMNAVNAYNDALSTQLGAGQAAGNLYNAGLNTQISAGQAAGNLYNTGIGQQVVAGNTAQQLANQAYTDSAALSEAGGVLDDYQQQLINADIDRYNYTSQQPLTALSNYNQLIQGSYGGTTTSTGKQGSGSRLGNVAGGALSGAGTGAMIGGPMGAAIGAIGGGLLGLL